jgi:ElaB/YqjD/DUF883 family membrane-anchored ribosome-binding protein
MAQSKTADETLENAAVPAGDDSFYGKARDARDKLNSVLTDLKGKAAETEKAVRKTLGHAEESVRQGVQHTETKIKEYPFAAVGIAAGLGFIIGLLINRSR